MIKRHKASPGGAVTPAEIQEGLSAFFAETDLDLDVVETAVVVTDETTAARELDASDFIVGSVDMVAPDSSEFADASSVLDELQRSDSVLSESDLIESDVEFDVSDSSSETEDAEEALMLHDVPLDEVDIDLFGESEAVPDPGARVDEHHVGGDETIETDTESSVQVSAGELQPVVSSALVVNQKTAEITEYYPTIDPLDSTQSEFDLDVPSPPVPGGFFRRWYIRGAAYLKQWWRRVQRSLSGKS